MERDFDIFLADWRKRPKRKPLLVRGARQTGKTYAVRKFGRQFDRYVEINFERSPRLKSVFDRDLDPARVCREIGLLLESEIIPGKTLLFLDEIQACPQAITALRYFGEDMPHLHVVAAGSLVEFALEGVSIPVGRVHYAYVRPFSFSEFLRATGNQMLDAALNEPVNSEAVHRKALDLVRDYLLVGGMPGALSAYVDTGSLVGARAEQRDIVQTYRDDFLKYASRAQLPGLQSVFDAVPHQIGKKTMFSEIDPDAYAYQIRTGLELMEKAQVICRVFSTSGSGLPLSTGASRKHFKTIFVDVGLVQYLSGLDMHELLNSPDLAGAYRGSLAEQFVGQELLHLQGVHERGSLYYWHRRKAGSQAEIDYLTRCDGAVVPIEVKSSAVGRLKSLHQFLAQHQSIPYGVKISQARYSVERTVVSIPLYAVAQLGGLYRLACG